MGLYDRICCAVHGLGYSAQQLINLCDPIHIVRWGTPCAWWSSCAARTSCATRIGLKAQSVNQIRDLVRSVNSCAFDTPCATEWHVRSVWACTAQSVRLAQNPSLCDPRGSCASGQPLVRLALVRPACLCDWLTISGFHVIRLQSILNLANQLQGFQTYPINQQFPIQAIIDQPAL